jgi:hypothetical protein
MPGRGVGEVCFLHLHIGSQLMSLQRLQVDPNLNSIIYFGAHSGNGLWKSMDSGVTWNKVTSFTWPGKFTGVYMLGRMAVEFSMVIPQVHFRLLL